MSMINEENLSLIKQKLRDIEETIGSMTRDIWFSDVENYKKTMDDCKQLQYILECVGDASNRIELIKWKMEKEQV
jgi:hypothetical protein